jgi:ABC-2 type transport system permease protein
VTTFPFLLRPPVLAWRNRTRRPERGDLARTMVFGCIALVVYAVLILGTMWLTRQVARYEELGDFLVRLGLSWLFLACLSFLTFSGIVTALSTFFLAEDLRLLFAAPIPGHQLFHARFAKTLGHASWMVVALIVPVLIGIGLGRSAPALYYVTAIAAVLPFAVIPVAIGCAVTLMLVNVFPARRARDLLMLMGLMFAGVIVMLLRYMQPEQLLRVESLPDVMAFFSTLQSPVTPLLPSFWAGEVLFAGLLGRVDALHAAALWTTAMAAVVALSGASARWHFAGYSKSQEARKARFARYVFVERLAGLLPLSAPCRALLVRDIKMFLRDVTQWSQLLLLLALVLIYLYNFRVLDLDRIPAMGAVIKNAYAFLNLGLAGLVMATITVRFVFPAVSSEGTAFWIIRTSPVSLRDYLWSRYWSGWLPVACLTTGLTVAANELLGINPFLKVVTTTAIVFMGLALAGLAVGLGARYPRFDADNANQIAGSFGGVAFMSAAVLFVVVMLVLLAWPSSVYLFYQTRNRSIPGLQLGLIGLSFTSAVVLCLIVWLYSMRSGIAALHRMDRA